MDNSVDSSTIIRTVAIIGSGISGLTLAIQLKQAGIGSVLFEKSRGPGGRLASKRVEQGNESVDIGAQYFTIRSPRFRAFLDQHAGEDSYAEWRGVLRYQRPDQSWTAFRGGARYVGVPRMTAISRALSEQLDIRFQTRVARLEQDQDQRWTVFDEEGNAHGGFDAVFVTAPPFQTRTLLTDSGLNPPAQDPIFHDYPLQACWTVAACFPHPIPFEGDGMSASHPVLQWVANNSSKPGRSQVGQWWVLHARADWSEAHQDAPSDWVRDQMLAAFEEVIGQSVQADESFSHRWLYAKTVNDEAGPGHRWYPDLSIGLCGDWLTGGRVEGAFQSAESILSDLRDRGLLE